MMVMEMGTEEESSLIYRLGNLLLESIYGGFQGRREAAAIEFRRLAPNLQAFNHGNVFIVGELPQVDGQVAQGFIVWGHGVISHEVEHHALQGATRAQGIYGKY